MVIHHSSTQCPYAHVVRELDAVDIRAVGFDVGTVVNPIILIDQTDASRPVPSFLRDISVGIIVGVPSKTSAKVEEASIGNGILVVVSAEERVHLPPEPNNY